MSDKSPAKPNEQADALFVLGTRLSTLQRAYRHAVDEAVRALGLSQATVWPLLTLGRQGRNMRPSELANLLEVPSLTRKVDHLVEMGLVERSNDLADRRTNSLHLTPAGITMCAECEALLRELQSTLLLGFSETDLSACARIFDLLDDQLRLATSSGKRLQQPPTH